MPEADYARIAKPTVDARGFRADAVAQAESVWHHYSPNCLPPDRLVLFIRVAMFKEVGYIVELEPLRGQPPYTLTVLPPEDGAPLTIKAVTIHLNEWINRMGRSDLHALQKQSKACRVRTSTHRAFGTDAWVSRVFKKLVKKSAQSSAWARGRAG